MEHIDNSLSNITWTDRWSVYLWAANLVVTIIVALLIQRWTSRYWHRQKKHEINYELEGAKYMAMLEAAKGAWSLLAYITEKENGKCVLIYKGTKDKPEIYFDLDRGRKYLQAVSETFYDKGHGIFLTAEIKQEIFHIRTNIYKIIDKEEQRGKTSGEVLLENEEVVTFFRNSYDRLHSKLKLYMMSELKYEVNA